MWRLVLFLFLTPLAAAPVQEQLAVVAEAASKAAPLEGIEVYDGPRHFRVHIFDHPTLVQRIKDLFGLRKVPSSEATIAYFQRTFGGKRLERMAARSFVNLGHAGALTKRDIGGLFAAAAEVTVEDLQELLAELRDRTMPSVRHLTPYETRKLRHTFATTSAVDQLSPPQIATLRAILAPFATLDDALLHDIPHLCDHDYLSREQDQFLDLRVRVRCYDYLSRYPINSHEWLLCLAKGVNHRTPPEGVVIPSKEGFLYTHAIIQGGGAWKTCLKVLGERRPGCGNWVLYRGTRFPPTASDTWEVMGSTLLEDFSLQIGASGPQATYDATQAMLYDPSMGFVSSAGERVNFIGTSLGGVHAQRDALLFSDKWARCITVCSPGIDTNAELALQIPLRRADDPVHIEHYFEYDDFVDEFGEVHLGASNPTGARVRIHVVREGHISDTRLLDRVACPETIAQVLLHYNTAASGGHVRATFLQPFYVVTLSSEQPSEVALVTDLLGHRPPHRDPRWEEIRKEFLNKLSSWTAPSN